jgi:hypothetical protein
MKKIAVTIHGFPADLDKAVEEYAAETSGTGRPSKGGAYADLVRKGLGVVRGDVGAGGVKRGE